MLSSIVDNQRLKEKCQIFTPIDIVTQMLDLANYKEKLYGKKILENSCGNGEILAQIVQRYIDSCKKQHKSRKAIKAGLEKDIVAYEIDKKRILECTIRLNNIAEEYKIPQVNWDIRCEDFLKSNNKETFDFVIGNPPYIAYPDLPTEIQSFVKTKFKTCQKGKFDYSYAFIEKSYQILSNKGTLIYIIPSNIFKNVFASNLRQLIKSDIKTIIDFPTDSVFKKVLVSPAIINIVKGTNSMTLSYTSNKVTRIISKKSLGEKWVFFDGNQNIGKRLGDDFKVSSSVATLLNDAFVLKGGTFEKNYYILDKFKIEIDLLRKAASPKNKKYHKFKEYIIFPYYYDNNGKLAHYSEEEMLLRFPCAMEYLESYRNRLEMRNSDKNALWFEYGRSQALQNLNQQVILISSVISSCTQAYLLEKGEIPYSGLYIIPKGHMPLDDLLSILNSDDFRKYVNGVGVCVSGTSKRVTPSDIENYIFDIKSH